MGPQTKLTWLTLPFGILTLIYIDITGHALTSVWPLNYSARGSYGLPIRRWWTSQCRCHIFCYSWAVCEGLIAHNSWKLTAIAGKQNMKKFLNHCLSTLDNHESINCHVFKLHCLKMKPGETKGEILQWIRFITTLCDLHNDGGWNPGSGSHHYQGLETLTWQRSSSTLTYPRWHQSWQICALYT